MPRHFTVWRILSSVDKLYPLIRQQKMVKEFKRLKGSQSFNRKSLKATEHLLKKNYSSSDSS